MTERTTGRRILTQVDIEEAISKDIEQLSEATENYVDLLKAEAKADVKYKRKKYRVFYQANGSVRDKEAFSESECVDEYEEFKLAEAEAKGLREVMRTLSTRLDSLRSLNTNVRNQL